MTIALLLWITVFPRCDESLPEYIYEQLTPGATTEEIVGSPSKGNAYEQQIPDKPAEGNVGAPSQG